MRERVLVVADDPGVREQLSAALGREGFTLVTTPPGRDVPARLAKDGPFDVILTDLSLAEMGGLELMAHVRRAQPDAEVVVLAGAEAGDAAQQALRMGAADFLRVPLRAAEASATVKRALLVRALMGENEGLRRVIRAFESARTLSACLETADVLPLTLDILSAALGRERAVARLVDEDSSDPIEGIYLRGLGDAEAAELRALIEQRKLFDPSELERPVTRGSEGLRSALERRGLGDAELLALPLRVDGRVAGAIWLFSDGEPFTPGDVRCAEIVVKQAELALLNSERFSHATEKAFVDDVTELYNARYLLAALDREIERADRGGLALSVLFLDLDRFKLVNDRYGHLVGSAVLCELGGVLRDAVRAVDTVGRYGGDEFTILLVDTGLEGAHNVAERIRSAVMNRIFGANRGLRLELTLSVGLATFPAHGSTREQLIDAADKAMYLAKALGRNRVCTADDLAESLGS
jgi:diguanylate cyclase (GGDEF)-like protein